MSGHGSYKTKLERNGKGTREGERWGSGRGRGACVLFMGEKGATENFHYEKPQGTTLF